MVIVKKRHKTWWKSILILFEFTMGSYRQKCNVKAIKTGHKCLTNDYKDILNIAGQKNYQRCKRNVITK